MIGNQWQSVVIGGNQHQLLQVETAQLPARILLRHKISGNLVFFAQFN